MAYHSLSITSFLLLLHKSVTHSRSPPGTYEYSSRNNLDILQERTRRFVLFGWRREGGGGSEASEKVNEKAATTAPIKRRRKECARVEGRRCAAWMTIFSVIDRVLDLCSTCHTILVAISGWSVPLVIEPEDFFQDSSALAVSWLLVQSRASLIVESTGQIVRSMSGSGLSIQRFVSGRNTTGRAHHARLSTFKMQGNTRKWE